MLSEIIRPIPYGIHTVYDREVKASDDEYIRVLPKGFIGWFGFLVSFQLIVDLVRRVCSPSFAPGNQVGPLFGFGKWL